MSRAHVNGYTRHLANGSTVKVGSHERGYTPGNGRAWNGKRSPLSEYRRERMKAQARVRRREAMRQGGVAAKKGWVGTKKRARQSWKMMRRANKRLARAYHMAHKKKRLGAGILATGALIEVTAAVSYSVLGVVVATVSILVATLAGGLLVGGAKQPQGKTGESA